MTLQMKINPNTLQIYSESFPTINCPLVKNLQTTHNYEQTAIKPIILKIQVKYNGS